MAARSERLVDYAPDISPLQRHLDALPSEPRKLGRDPFADALQAAVIAPARIEQPGAHPCARWHAWRREGAHEVCLLCFAARRVSRAPLVLLTLAGVVSWIALCGVVWGVVRAFVHMNGG